MTEEYPNYQCVFCLYENKIWYFEMKNSKGKILQMKQCPSCFRKFRRSSLMKSEDLTPDSYAKWIVFYPFGDFWKRISPDFDKWKKKMYELLGSNIGLFWDSYKKWKLENLSIIRPDLTDEEIDKLTKEYEKSFEEKEG